MRNRHAIWDLFYYVFFPLISSHIGILSEAIWNVCSSISCVGINSVNLPVICLTMVPTHLFAGHSTLRQSLRSSPAATPSCRPTAAVDFDLFLWPTAPASLPAAAAALSRRRRVTDRAAATNAPVRCRPPATAVAAISARRIVHQPTAGGQQCRRPTATSRTWPAVQRSADRRCDGADQPHVCGSGTAAEQRPRRGQLPHAERAGTWTFWQSDPVAVQEHG